MRRKQAAEQALALSTPSLIQQTAQTTRFVQQAVDNIPLRYPSNTVLVSHTSVNAQRAVSSLFHQKTYKHSGNPLPLLDNLWKHQASFTKTPLFPLFIRHYYAAQFGDLSPHMEYFFDKVGSLQDRELELRITKRLYYLAQNNYLLSDVIFPDLLQMPARKSFRARYLKNIAALTPETFEEENLVLSFERRMSLNPYHDFPIRHVNGRVKVKIGQEVYPVFAYNGPFDNLSILYRFLLNGSKHPHQHITFVFDEEGQSLALFNHDHTLWLRISPHEFSFPENLHVHLNELRTVDFVNLDGVPTTELINLNLSIPLSTPPDLPRYKPKDFLYKKMILEPVKASKQNAHVTIEKRPIW